MEIDRSSLVKLLVIHATSYCNYLSIVASKATVPHFQYCMYVHLDSLAYALLALK